MASLESIHDDYVPVRKSYPGADFLPPSGAGRDRGTSRPGFWVAGKLYARYYARHDAGNGEVMSVPYALLALLSEGPKFGLQLREEFEARTGEVWPLNVGQVYKTLGRLER